MKERWTGVLYGWNYLEMRKESGMRGRMNKGGNYESWKVELMIAERMNKPAVTG
jgi:hypothetical protein